MRFALAVDVCATGDHLGELCCVAKVLFGGGGMRALEVVRAAIDTKWEFNDEWYEAHRDKVPHRIPI